MGCPQLTGPATPPFLPDLLFALLLPLCPTAPLRAGEASPRVHTLLRVPRHALLQRQGRRLTVPALARLPGPKGLPGRHPGRLPAPSFQVLASRGFTAFHQVAATETSRTSVPPSQPRWPPDPWGPQASCRGQQEVKFGQRGYPGCQVAAQAWGAFPLPVHWPAELLPQGSANAEGLLSTCS